MKRFWFHFSVFFLLAIFQFSLVNVAAAYRMFTPNILLATVIAWMLRKEFSWVWWRAIALGLAYDLVSGGPIGLSALLLLWFAYATSFLSRRLLVEQRSGSGLVTAAGLTAVFSVAYAVLDRTLSLFERAGFFHAGWTNWGVFFWQSPVLALMNFIVFFALVGVIRRFDRYVFSDRSVGFGSLAR